MTYWTLRFDAAVVFPKCPAAFTASLPRSPGVAFDGAGTAVSAQTPASGPPAGYWTWAPDDGQSKVPAGTSSQYWVMTPDHRSPAVPIPASSATRRGATPAASLLNCIDPGGFSAPHCDP